MNDNRKSFVPWIIAIVSVQASMILYLENSYLKKENRICHSAGNLLRDQISELNFAVYKLTSEKDYAATRNYVLGATQAINEPRMFGDVWHDGYDKGLNQTRYVAEHVEE